MYSLLKQKSKMLSVNKKKNVSLHLTPIILQSYNTLRTKMCTKKQELKWLEIDQVNEVQKKLSIVFKMIIWITRPIMKQFGQFLLWIVLSTSIQYSKKGIQTLNYSVQALFAHAGAYLPGAMSEIDKKWDKVLIHQRLVTLS
jgi:hypothetical protein